MTDEHNRRDEILSRLKELEVEDNVRIFYACESGSRAWGFPSADSDYDVRFLYLRPRDWYLSIDVEDKRDVIERPINDLLDINGWDLRKALKLLKKSNPPLLEWLNSPIVYQQDAALIDGFRALMPEYYSPVACLYHYLQMARGNYRDYLKSETVRVKKYFYVLRPLLAILWIENESEVVPMEFGVLLERSVKSPELKATINDLLERKKAGQELDRAPRIEIIGDFIERELARLETVTVAGKPKTDNTKLNEFFRVALEV